MDSPSWWDATRLALRDEILAAVRTQLEAGHQGPVVARWIARLQLDLRFLDIQAGPIRQDVVTTVRHRLAQFLAITADDRPQSALYTLKRQARWLETYIQRFRTAHPRATASQWRERLTDAWVDIAGNAGPLLQKTIDEVRDAKTPKAAALKLLATATGRGEEELARVLARVDLAREARRSPSRT